MWGQAIHMVITSSSQTDRQGELFKKLVAMMCTNNPNSEKTEIKGSSRLAVLPL